MCDYLPKKSTFTPAIKPFLFTQKAKPTSQPILQPLIDKARAEVAARQPAAAAAKAAPKAAAAAPPKKAPPKTIYDDSPDESGEPEAVKKAAAAAAAAAPAAKKPEKEEKAKKEEKGPAAAAAGAAKKKGGEDEDFGPIMQVSDKQRRVNEERALKTLKWNFDVPRKEFVEQLRNQIEAANWNKTLIGMIRQWA